MTIQRVTTDARFAVWMERVDAILVKRCGLDSKDLPDCCYYDWFSDGETPAAAAREALRSAREEM